MRKNIFELLNTNEQIQFKKANELSLIFDIEIHNHINKELEIYKASNKVKRD